MDRRFFHRLGASRLDRTICSTAGMVGMTEASGGVTPPSRSSSATLGSSWRGARTFWGPTYTCGRSSSKPAEGREVLRRAEEPEVKDPNPFRVHHAADRASPSPAQPESRPRRTRLFDGRAIPGRAYNTPRRPIGVGPTVISANRSSSKLK